MKFFDQDNSICKKTIYDSSTDIRSFQWHNYFENSYIILLSCFNSLLVNSISISKKGKFGGALAGSSNVSETANSTPSRCSAVIASLFLRASKPKERAKRLANS